MVLDCGFGSHLLKLPIVVRIVVRIVAPDCGEDCGFGSHLLKLPIMYPRDPVYLLAALRAWVRKVILLIDRYQRCLACVPCTDQLPNSTVLPEKAP